MVVFIELVVFSAVATAGVYAGDSKDPIRAPTQLSEKEINALLDRHNEYRRKVSPSGTNIRLLSWDGDLAGRAQAYANKCRFVHSARTTMEPFGYIGENIYITSQQTTGVEDIARSVTAWFNEHRDYDFASNTCAPKKSCGHYTQVVWDDTYKVGCGKVKCNRTVKVRKKNYFNPTMIVCKYGPSGNVKPLFTPKARRPFRKGEPCSDCPDDAPVCVDRLCDERTFADEDVDQTVPQTLKPFTTTSNSKEQARVPVKKKAIKFMPPNFALRCFICEGQTSSGACVELNQTKQCGPPDASRDSTLPLKDKFWSCARYKETNLVKMDCMPTTECQNLQQDDETKCCGTDFCNNAKTVKLSTPGSVLAFTLAYLIEFLT